MKSRSTPVSDFARDNDITVFKPETAEQLEAIEQMTMADMLLVIAYGMRVPQSVLSRPACGCVNVHYSLLPRWRGAAPVNYAISNGDQVTGVSIFRLEAELDTGPVLFQKECPVGTDDTSGTLLQKLNDICCDILPGCILKILEQKVEAIPQQHEHACYAPRITRDDTIIDWHSQGAAEIERLVRAMHPRPLARTSIAGTTLLLHKVQCVATTAGNLDLAPGQVLHAADGFVDIVAADGNSVRLITVQAEGRQPLPLKEFINGRPELRHIETI